MSTVAALRANCNSEFTAKCTGGEAKAPVAIRWNGEFSGTTGALVHLASGSLSSVAHLAKEYTPRLAVSQVQLAVNSRRRRYLSGRLHSGHDAHHIRTGT